MSNPYETPQPPLPPPPTPPYGYQPGSPADAMAIISLVTGLIGLGMTMCCGMFALPLPIISLITGIFGLKSAQQRGLAIGGIVCASIGLLITIAFVIYFFVIVAVGASQGYQP